MSAPIDDPPCDHDALELITACRAGCLRTMDALVHEAADTDAEESIRSLCSIAVSAVRIAPDARGVAPNDILATISRSASAGLAR